jgi:hypothetical protein
MYTNRCAADVKRPVMLMNDSEYRVGEVARIGLLISRRYVVSIPKRNSLDQQARPKSTAENVPENVPGVAQ